MQLWTPGGAFPDPCRLKIQTICQMGADGLKAAIERLQQALTPKDELKK